ncbi:MAG: AAA family ATPase, partial [Clostridia bacterium]|nr:AAA family ATPase [Clostridia bacterium]
MINIDSDRKTQLIEDALNAFSAWECDYTEWTQVGMALHEEGFPLSVWDEWSKNDKRYHVGECERKWHGFGNCNSPVKGGTLISIAKKHGFRPAHSGNMPLEWDDEIVSAPTQESRAQSHTAAKNDTAKNEIRGIPVKEPAEWNPAQQAETYIKALFEESDYVGYVTETYEYEKDGEVKAAPSAGAYTRTAGQLLTSLEKHTDDIESTFGTYRRDTGAWVRINPLDGKGVKNENVTAYKYALVESDSMPIEQQYALILDMKLPCAVIVYSGGKSLHAIVRVNAKNLDEYRQKVAYLYATCKQNGLDVDEQNKNPSRLSRLPGFERNGKKQYIVATDTGFSTFEQWRDYIDDDGLPPLVYASDFLQDLPPLAPELIPHVLRQGHKMLVSGASKAGKSYLLNELAMAIALGRDWLGFGKCAQGKVLLINMEIDDASEEHRIGKVAETWHVQPTNTGLKNLALWNLRGKSQSLDNFVPVIIRRVQREIKVQAATGEPFAAVIIDPIYKVITGDENSASDMAYFCNQFDKLASELNCAVIYAHHHSKGAQGGKAAQDRASGSGVFARDPDAIIDMTETKVEETLRESLAWNAEKEVYAKWLDRYGIPHDKEDSVDVLEQLTHTEIDGKQTISTVETGVTTVHERIEYELDEARTAAQTATAFK